MRVTTGSVEIKGWEKDLIKRSPNLARWHWDPLYANTQGYLKAGRTPMPVHDSKPGSHYVQSTHVPTIISARSHYIKPIHAATNVPVQEHLQGEVRNQNTHQSVSESTSARLTVRLNSDDKEVAGELLTKSDNQIATYGKIYDTSPHSSERQSNSQVHGQIRKKMAKVQGSR